MTKVEAINALEEYELVKALLERKKELEKYEDDDAIESVNRLIDQLEGITAYDVLIEE